MEKKKKKKKKKKKISQLRVNCTRTRSIPADRNPNRTPSLSVHTWEGVLPRLTFDKDLEHARGGEADDERLQSRTKAHQRMRAVRWAAA